MKIVEIKEHSFKKTNLTTVKGGGDKYRCSVCGCEGYRPAFTEIVQLTEKEYLKAKKCAYVSESQVRPRPSKVEIYEVPGICLNAGRYDVVPCPDEYKQKFEKDVWVFHPDRKEAVRILDGEILEKFY
jgi:hypothetical protein